MTVNYSAKVASSSFACFLKLLIRWRGSIYKLLWPDFILFASAYFTLSFVYRFALNKTQKHTFESVAKYCESYNNLIPLAFVLGFYVSVVVTRWWEQFLQIPWPDRMALFVTANIQGHDERGRLMRRTMLRYLCLSYVITMSSISSAVRKRFPNFQHMTDAGFMLSNEQKILEDMKTPHNKYFVPLAWTTSLVTRARKENRIRDDFAVKTLIDEINEFRGKLGTLFNYDWVGVPLVYTQVVTLAVYTFFISCLMGRQFLENGHVGDMYVPVFTFLQFLFYMGWLKVAETLVNPFGEDDDDFDMNILIDRNLQVSYLIVDEMHQEHPDLIKDQYWDEVDFELPYTAASEPFRITNPHLGSAMDVTVTPKDAEFIQLNSIQEHTTDELQRRFSGRLIDIPRQRTSVGAKLARGATSPTSSTRPGNLFSRIRRSFSKESRNTSDTLDSPKNQKKPQKINIPDSISSLNTSTQQSPSKISTMDPDEIFNMSDLDDVEDELDHRTESAAHKDESHGLLKPKSRLTDSPLSVRQKEAEKPPQLTEIIEDQYSDSDTYSRTPEVVLADDAHAKFSPNSGDSWHTLKPRYISDQSPASQDTNKNYKTKKMSAPV